MKIAFIYAEGRSSRRTDVASRKIPSEFFYGGEDLKAWGHHIEYIEINREAGSKRRRLAIDRMFRMGLLPNRCRAQEMLGTHALLPDLLSYDVIIATSTGLAFSLGLWQMFGCRIPPLVSIHCGIFNYPPNAWRRMMMRRLLGHSWSVVFGEAEAQPIRDTFSLARDRVMVNQFGVDTTFWLPPVMLGDGQYVLAVGNDARRDYKTLVEASRILGPGIPIKILSRLPMPPHLPRQVEVLAADWKQKQLTDRELLTLYQGARVVVTPLQEALQPSGQSVTLQAMACGRPVVMTRTSGLWDPLRMRDGYNIKLVPPGDAATMARVIGDLWGDQEKREQLASAARTSVELDYSILNFARGMETICLRAVEESFRRDSSRKARKAIAGKGVYLE